MTTSTMTNSDLFDQKVWGNVRHVFHGPACASVLQVNAGTYCSVHRHHKRWNHFLVTSGDVDIVLYSRSEAGLLQVTNRYRLSGHPLIAAQGYTVPPSVWHRFEVIKSGTIIEGYWTNDGSPADIMDIERVQEGGKF